MARLVHPPPSTPTPRFPFYDFYKEASVPNMNGLTLNYFLYEMGHLQMEKKHDYIQWLFPGPTISKMRADAAPFPCTETEYQKMATDRIIMGRIQDAITKVLAFWGITYDEDAQTVKVRKRHEHRFLDVLILYRDHNQARFTRLITFSRCIGMVDLAEALFALVTRYHSRIYRGVYEYWVEARHSDIQYVH
jgi:hypothetical protein